jgi:hypothetical protein
MAVQATSESSDESRGTEHVVRSDASPLDVRLASADGFAVRERRPTIARPRHLEDARRALDAFHAETGAEPAPAFEILDELANRALELVSLLRRQRFVVAVEAIRPLVRWHARLVL